MVHAPVAGQTALLDRARLRAALLSIALTICLATAFAWQLGSAGWTAVLLIMANLCLLIGYICWAGDRPMGALLVAAGVLGGVELLADFLCVRCTGTLDYTPARSSMILASPWWMPLLWMVVAVQIGTVGDLLIRRFGLAGGLILGGLVGASLIPLYEGLAWRAHWWSYRNCLQVGHVPIYIVVAEAIIGAGLVVLGYAALRACPARAAILLGAISGALTILGGILGWGLVEFICRGARPGWAQLR